MTTNMTNPKLDQEKIEVFKLFLQELIEDSTSTYATTVLKVVKTCVSIIKGDKKMEDVASKQYLYVEFLLNYKDFFNKFLKLDTITSDDLKPFYSDLLNLFTQWKSQSEIITELKEKYTRLYAEFDNYKKRAHKERIDMIGEIKFKSNRDIINILDDLNLAKVNLSETENKGLALIFNKLDSYLEGNSIKKVEINKGDKFNPEICECIAVMPAPTLSDGEIVDILKVPYTIDDKIVRFGQVVVCKN